MPDTAMVAIQRLISRTQGSLTMKDQLNQFRSNIDPSY